MSHVHLHLLISSSQLRESSGTTAFDWVVAHRLGRIRFLFEEVLEKKEEVILLPTVVSHLTPRQLQFDLEFVVETGRYFDYANKPLTLAIVLYSRLETNPNWQLPAKWALTFRHKGPSDDISISQHNIVSLMKQCVQPT